MFQADDLHRFYVPPREMAAYEQQFMAWVRQGRSEEKPAFPLLRERRVSLARQGKARQGKLVGPVPFGYRNKKVSDADGRERTTGVLEPSDDAPAVRLAYDLYASGHYSYLDVAKELNQRGWRIWNIQTLTYNVLSKDTIREILHNPIYIGKIVYKGAINEGQHEGIVPPETYQAVEKLRQARQQKAGRVSVGGSPRSGMLTEVVYCVHCGARLYHRGNQNADGTFYRKQSYYVCGNRNRCICDAPFSQSTRIDQQIAELVRQLVLPDTWRDEILAVCKAHQERPKAKQPVDVAALERKLKRLQVLFVDGDLSENEYRAQKQQLHALLREAQREQDVAAQTDETHLLETLNNLATVFDKATLVERRALIKHMFSHIWVDKHEVKAITPKEEFLPLFVAMRKVHLVSREGIEPATLCLGST